MMHNPSLVDAETRSGIHPFRMIVGRETARRDHLPADLRRGTRRSTQTPNFKLQTPNFKLQTLKLQPSNSKLQTPNSKPSNSKPSNSKPHTSPCLRTNTSAPSATDRLISKQPCPNTNKGSTPNARGADPSRPSASSPPPSWPPAPPHRPLRLILGPPERRADADQDADATRQSSKFNVQGSKS